MAMVSPLVAVAGPDQYDRKTFGIVSGAVAPPVVKLVHDTVAVQDRPSFRSSVTVTVPRCAVRLALVIDAEPRLVLVGTVMASAASAGDAVTITPAAIRIARLRRRPPVVTAP